MQAKKTITEEMKRQINFPVAAVESLEHSGELVGKESTLNHMPILPLMLIADLLPREPRP